MGDFVAAAVAGTAPDPATAAAVAAAVADAVLGAWVGETFATLCAAAYIAAADGAGGESTNKLSE